MFGCSVVGVLRAGRVAAASGVRCQWAAWRPVVNAFYLRHHDEHTKLMCWFFMASSVSGCVHVARGAVGHAELVGGGRVGGGHGPAIVNLIWRAPRAVPAASAARRAAVGASIFIKVQL